MDTLTDGRADKIDCRSPHSYPTSADGASSGDRPRTEFSAPTPRTLTGTEEITEMNPPKTWAVRGVGGSLAATAKGTIEPLDDGQRSRVTIALEFEAHGIGKLLLPLVRRQARKQLPRNEQHLKEMLER
jgi:hypothetical protein